MGEALWELEHMQILEIQSNPLACDFPTKMCNWKYLQTLRARDCQFTGRVPAEMAVRCPNLSWVALNRNAALDASSVVELVCGLSSIQYSDMAQLEVIAEQKQ